MKEINCMELKSWMDNKKDFQLVDVREEHEREIASIGGDHIPMGDVMDNLDKISRDKNVVILCRTGNRSGAITKALMQQGFSNILNLKGGITAWSDEVDPTVTKY